MSEELKSVITKKKVKELIREIINKNILVRGKRLYTKKVQKRMDADDDGFLNTVWLYEDKKGEFIWSFGNKKPEEWRWTGIRLLNFYTQKDKRSPLIMKNLGILDEEIYKNINTSPWAYKKRWIQNFIGEDLKKVNKYLDKVKIKIVNGGEHDLLVMEYDIRNGLPKEVKDGLRTVNGENLSEMLKVMQRNRVAGGRYMGQPRGRVNIARLVVTDDFLGSWNQTHGLAIELEQMVKTGEVDYKLIRASAQKELPKYIEDKIKKDYELESTIKKYSVR